MPEVETIGVADRVFELEANIPGDVVERLLEIPLEGDFTFPAQAGFTSRTIAIRGKADRVDVLADGSLRVIDYKLGHAMTGAPARSLRSAKLGEPRILEAVRFDPVG